MKITWVMALALLLACNTKKSKEAEVPREKLEDRLAAFFKANDEMNFEKVLDFTYPRVFELAPRAALLKEMKSSFEGEDLSMDIDSLETIRIYPELEIEKAHYVKIKYRMLMLMKFHRSDRSDSVSFYENVKASMDQEFGAGNVAIDAANDQVRIRQSTELVGIRDSYSPEWTFITMDKDQQAFLNKLFSREVQDKLAAQN